MFGLGNFSGLQALKELGDLLPRWLINVVVAWGLSLHCVCDVASLSKVCVGGWREDGRGEDREREGERMIKRMPKVEAWMSVLLLFETGPLCITLDALKLSM